MRVSEEINKEIIKKTKKKRTQKLNKVNDLKKKILHKNYEMEEKIEKHKEKLKESGEGLSPQIIILDFSSSGNCEDDEDSGKDKNVRTSQKEDKYIDKKINKNNNLKFNKIDTPQASYRVRPTCRPIHWCSNSTIPARPSCGSSRPLRPSSSGPWFTTRVNRTVTTMR